MSLFHRRQRKVETPRTRRPRRWNYPRLVLEWLEDRITPDAVTWTGLGDGASWHQAANWDLHVPANGDDVVIPNVGPTTSVQFTTSAVSVQLNSLSCTELFVMSGSG